MSDRTILLAILFLAIFYRGAYLNVQPIGYFGDEGWYASTVKNICNDPKNFLYPVCVNGPSIHHFDPGTPSGKILINKPPAFFWLSALCARPFGCNEESMRFFSVICGSATVLAVYLFARVLFDRRTGLLAAFLLASYPAHIILSSSILLETASLCYTTLIAYLFIKGTYDRDKRPLIAAIFLTALLMLTRGPEIAILLGILSGLSIIYWRERKTYIGLALLALMGGILLSLIWYVMVWLTPDRYDGFLWCQGHNVWYLLFRYNLTARLDHHIDLFRQAGGFFKNRVDIVIPVLAAFMMAAALFMRRQQATEERRRHGLIILLSSFFLYFIPVFLLNSPAWRRMAPLFCIYAVIISIVMCALYDRFRMRHLRTAAAVFALAALAIRPMVLLHPPFSILKTGYPSTAQGYPRDEMCRIYKAVGEYIKDRTDGYNFSALVPEANAIMTYHTGKLALSSGRLPEPAMRYVLNREVRYVGVTDLTGKEYEGLLKERGRSINSDAGIPEICHYRFYDCFPEEKIMPDKYARQERP